MQAFTQKIDKVYYSWSQNALFLIPNNSLHEHDLHELAAVLAI